ncbi:hypothetical protein EDEG_02676 [Edhazardia aedis USNM 41457]|uniref:Uncharacterized protein n=1 Tax=Edhazardia aedis (strain USNM 41457) TaxID=1003232 RepID=J9D5W4_EDHAE|nr:hypothetical protein EDEG_02676 [Edhazardia aedis USNM 41457]|eukprot:EJW02934.1 hypothetical protein EDEG_02676 [Edhazardia aedis USNM 41457]
MITRIFWAENRAKLCIFVNRLITEILTSFLFFKNNKIQSLKSSWCILLVTINKFYEIKITIAFFVLIANKPIEKIKKIEEIYLNFQKPCKITFLSYRNKKR